MDLIRIVNNLNTCSRFSILKKNKENLRHIKHTRHPEMNFLEVCREDVFIIR